jgi:hypothetical protein
MATQGNYDHPSYLTRQVIDLDVSTAGASGTSGAVSFISDMRLRKASVTIRTAGTSSGTGALASLIYIGTSYQGYGTLGGTNTLSTNTTTATLGSIALGSSTANTVVTFADMDARLVAGGVLAQKNGTDATSVYKMTLEMYLDPAATWTGPPGS